MNKTYVALDIERELWDFFTLPQIKSYIGDLLDLENMTEDEIPSLLYNDYPLILEVYE